MSKEILEHIPIDKKIEMYLKHNNTFFSLTPYKTKIELMDSYVKIFNTGLETRVPYEEIAFIEIEVGDED